MKRTVINGIFKIAILALVILGLSTCSGSKKATSSSDMFKIPKKIVSAEDLPAEIQANEPSETQHIQLFPDEATKQTETLAVAEPLTEPEEGGIEQYVDKIVDEVTHHHVRPVFYHIVSGSFQNKAYADLFAEHLKDIGYGNTYVRFFDNGFNRVIVQRYNNEVEARQYLQGYRFDNPKYSEAWLYYNLKESNDPMAYITN